MGPLYRDERAIFARSIGCQVFFVAESIEGAESRSLRHSDSKCRVDQCASHSKFSMSNEGVSATRPSTSTAHPHLRRGPMHVRWVFPASVITPLQSHHTIGRDATCDTVLDGQEISRKHAEFIVEGPISCIVDLESRNGVHVNGARTRRTILNVNDVVRCGEWIGIVELELDPYGFREISPGWFGGPLLYAAVEPASRIRPDLPIIVQGETGTGKEGIAQAVHRWNNRSGPFVAVNCATLNEQLAESELFGHRKGAFSGADRASPGLFRAAHGGTLFLDEILELPRALQAKLLRAIELKEVLPLGETKPVPVDARFIAATQEPLARAVSEGRFRADLHARLDGLTVILPPLRERRADIAPLALEFLRRATQGRAVAVEARLVEALCLYDWPLNVRELSLLIRQLADLCGTDDILKRSHLPERIVSGLRGLSNSVGPNESLKRAWVSTKDDTQFDALVSALREHGGSIAKAAAAIGVNRARAYRLLSAHPNVSLDEFKSRQ